MGVEQNTGKTRTRIREGQRMKIEGNNSLFNFKRAFPTSRTINWEQLLLELSTTSSTVL
jgi:hypothetical protein